MFFLIISWVSYKYRVHIISVMMVSFILISCRLILWSLDPLILKHDISEILREKIRRPFLCLKKELHNQLAWRSIIICLVASPTAFAETRALLHNWFLLT